MPTSSPYSNNDYSVFQTRPYNLPINQIAGAFQAKNNAWNQGAERIKSRYDAIAQMDLSKEENINIRNEYIKKSQADLQKLSASDLSDPNVQKAGTQLFDNILKDKAILYDNAATKHKQKIDADAEKARKTENGKYYNEANYIQALHGYDEFLKAPNRDAGAQYLQKAKEYTPYYDASDEISKISKDCGYNSVANQYSTGKYIAGVSDKSKSSQKIYGCLEAGLSPKAIKQKEIDGYAAYGKNYNILKDDFLEASNEKKNVYTTELGSLQAKKTALSNQKGKEQQIAILDQQINGFSEQISSINKDLNGDGKTSFGINGWDEKFVKDNYERLAGTAFSNRWKQSYSTAFATSEIANTLSGNPIYVAEYTQQEINKRTQSGYKQEEKMAGINYTYDVAIEQQKFENKLLLGQDENGNVLDPLQKVLGLSKIGKSSQEIQKFMGTAVESNTTNATDLGLEIVDLGNKNVEINNDLFTKLKVAMPDNDLLNKIGNTVNTPDDIAKVWRVAHDYLMTAGKNDPLALKINEAENLSNQTSNSKTARQSIYNTAKDNVERDNPDIYKKFNEEKNKIYSSLKPAVLFDKTTLTSSDLKMILDGTHPTLKGVIKTFETDKGNRGLSSENTGTIVNKSSGKTIGWFPEYLKLNNLNNDKSTNYNARLDEEIGKHVLVQKTKLVTGNIFTPTSMATKHIQGVGLGAYEINQTNNIDLTTGKVNIQVKEKGPNGAILSAAKVEEILKKGELGNAMYNKVDDNTISITIPGAVNLLRIPNNDLELRQIVTYAKENVGRNPGGYITEVGRGKVDQIKYELKVSKAIGGGYDYDILGNGQTMQLEKRTNDPEEDALYYLSSFLDPNAPKVIPKTK